MSADGALSKIAQKNIAAWPSSAHAAPSYAVSLASIGRGPDVSLITLLRTSSREWKNSSHTIRKANQTNGREQLK